MEIKTLLEQRGLLIFDGAMGTQLQAKGLKTVSYTHLDVYKRQAPSDSPCATS